MQFLQLHFKKGQYLIWAIAMFTAFLTAFICLECILLSLLQPNQKWMIKIMFIQNNYYSTLVILAIEQLCWFSKSSSYFWWKSFSRYLACSIKLKTYSYGSYRICINGIISNSCSLGLWPYSKYANLI